MTGPNDRVGRTIVGSLPGWTPRLLPPATYEPIQARERAKLKEELRKLLE